MSINSAILSTYICTYTYVSQRVSTPPLLYSLSYSRVTIVLFIHIFSMYIPIRQVNKLNFLTQLCLFILFARFGKEHRANATAFPPSFEYQLFHVSSINYFTVSLSFNHLSYHRSNSILFVFPMYRCVV